jgi:hypothetical protein
MGYKEELDALGRWIYKTAGLLSHRLSEAPPKVARPVVLWEAPTRRNGRQLGNYGFIRTVGQYGVLYVKNLDQLAELLDKLEKDLAERNDLLPMYASDQAGAAQIGWLKNVQLEHNTAQSVDVPIVVRYEVVQDRLMPEEAPAAVKVVTKLEKGAVNNG